MFIGRRTLETSGFNLVESISKKQKWESTIYYYSLTVVKLGIITFQQARMAQTSIRTSGKQGKSLSFLL